MKSFTIKQGLDIPLKGYPECVVEDLSVSNICKVHPAEIPGIRPSLEIAEGDNIAQGSILFTTKDEPKLKIRSPLAGIIKEITYGARRTISSIVIENQGDKTAEEFQKYSASDILNLSREETVEYLLNTGGLTYLRQRPFSKLPNLSVIPKSIFVNGMNKAAFQPSLEVLLAGQETEFQTGLNVLTRLTTGKVYLCLATDSKIQADNVDIAYFKGPNPAGNTSVHISRLDPMQPGDVIWTINAGDLIQLGKLFKEGRWPNKRIISVGGTGVKPEARKYYRIQVGTLISDILKDRLADGETRIIAGNALYGDQLELSSGLGAQVSGLTVLPEDRSRHFMGWIAPGLKFYSYSKSFLSSLLPFRKSWSLGTNAHGGLRPMILTGHYDRVMPMNIMVDHLLRAILAHDTDEAIQLGILETEPEDFALCAFICPSKVDVPGIVRSGLEEIEKEGLL